VDLDRLLTVLHPRVTEIRRDIHAHPELAFAEHRTAAIVARRLGELGYEVHTGLAGTGVVGRLRAGTGSASIGLRADMDALPIQEGNDFAHRSQHPGCMHACGHDGHVATLLGAAEALLAWRDASRFDGTVHLIFQPAEEHEGGGQRMVEEGLFKRFPMDMVFGLHNWPGLEAGTLAVREGPVMAGADRFDIIISGRGGHAAMPHLASDTVLAGAALVQAMQALVSRATDPLAAAVISVTRFHAGDADNVLPAQAVLGGTVRTFDTRDQERIAAGMQRVCDAVALAHGVTIDFVFRRGYPPTINAASAADVCRRAAVAAFGPSRLRVDLPPSMGAEDFAYLANAVPGCYAWIGNGPGQGGCMLHSPRYDFNDEIIPEAIRYWLMLVETALPV
jgi:hippurate hydrolase